MSYVTRKIKAARERGKRLANIRWAKDRAIRERIAAIEPANFGREIVRRIVVIDREEKAREIIFYKFDNYSDRRRKLREFAALSKIPVDTIHAADHTTP